MTITRRRFLSITAAASGIALAAPCRAGASTWRGRALGAPAFLHLSGLSSAEAAPIFVAVEAELARLENIFSLYRKSSALSRLNAAGHLATPPPELLEVLALSDTLHHASKGAFDPTVQPFFVAHEKALRQGLTTDVPTLAKARARVGWDAVQFDTNHISLHRQGAALTLNGIAQGYITDRVSVLLRAHGLTDVLIDMGEVAALGQNPVDRAPWRAGIRSAEGRLVKHLRLSDRALATSQPLSFTLGPQGHIFHPETGGTAHGAMLVSVSAPSAALADGLSTALCVLDRAQHSAALRVFPDATLEFIA